MTDRCNRSVKRAPGCFGPVRVKPLPLRSESIRRRICLIPTPRFPPGPTDPGSFTHAERARSKDGRHDARSRYYSSYTRTKALLPRKLWSAIAFAHLAVRGAGDARTGPHSTLSSYSSVARFRLCTALHDPCCQTETYLLNNTQFCKQFWKCFFEATVNCEWYVDNVWFLGWTMVTSEGSGQEKPSGLKVGRAAKMKQERPRRQALFQIAKVGGNKWFNAIHLKITFFWILQLGPVGVEDKSWVLRIGCCYF